LGRLICSGSSSLTEFPTSCEDLWLIGHTLNGFYSIKGTQMIESVYCDFTQLPSDTSKLFFFNYLNIYYLNYLNIYYLNLTISLKDFQKWIGYADVKSAPVHFYVKRNSTFFSPVGTPIPFDLAVVNEGNAMNLTSGIFTAPRPGIYFFSFTGMASMPASSSRVYLGVALYLNGGRIGMGYVSDENTTNDQDSPLTFQSTLNLKSGDQVVVALYTQSLEAKLYDNSPYHFTHFTGFMLQEKTAASF
jgi:hypothetical protein